MSLMALGGGIAGFIGNSTTYYVVEQTGSCLPNLSARTLLPWVITTGMQAAALYFVDNSPFGIGIKVGAIASSIFLAKYSKVLDTHHLNPNSDPYSIQPDHLFYSDTTPQINKAIYHNIDERQNLDDFESSESNVSFIHTVKKQAESVACLVSNRYLIQGAKKGWQLTSKTPTLAQVVENQFHEALGTYETFGEQESFRNEYAAGFGTAFLVGNKLAITAAHCICKKDSNILDEKIIQTSYLVFGFQNAKPNHSDYLFTDKQVYQIKQVISHQFTRVQDRNHNFTEWTDWALVELDREAPFTPLTMNMTKKIADHAGLYMLGHPYGLPVKFVGNGSVQRNHQKDFFECNLDAFGGNSGSPVFNKATSEVEGMLCSGGEDYKITDHYRGRHERKIQAHQITRQESGSKGYEICQRLNILRFLVDDHLLSVNGINRPQNAPELIIHSLKEYYQSRNTIPRLLYSALPIHEIYIELVLIQTNKKDKNQEEKKAFEESRVNSWEDIHASKEPIELGSLFINKEGKERKRLLILGGAGIGKSTLCQFIAHQWAEGKLWNDKFDALFWVPLRKLQYAHSSETAASFIFRHCCQEKSENLYTNDVTAYLKQNAGRILFVLDGLDEVAMEENSRQKAIVDELLKFPHWILTSRSHAAGSIQADATIENVGFASKTIDLYIEKFFPTNTQAIIQNIRQNPIIFGLCHIPINLELICSILKKSKGDISSINSMTGLYEELTLTLLRRYLEQTGRPEAWDWKSGQFERDPATKSFLELLESIAWKGMQEKQLFFSFKTKQMEEIYYNCELEKRDELFLRICKSGFLQSTGDSEDILCNEYSFLHLTFQEFFAARYLVRLLENREKRSEAAKSIRAVKFDPRFKVVMWFTAGLLRNEGGNFENLNTFFEFLDTPKDDVGFYSALLKVHCLEECSWQESLQKIKVYEQEILFWCERVAFKPVLDSMLQHLIETFEISPQGAKRFLIPQLSLCLSSEEVSTRRTAIKALGQVGHTSPQITLALLTKAFKDEDSGVREGVYLFKIILNDVGREVRELIVEALGRIGQTDPQAVLPLLAEALKDDYWFCRKKAVIALGQIGHADPQAVIPLLLEALKDKNEWVRECAVKVLGQIGRADTQSVLSLLAEALKNERSEVRERAVEALGQIGHADPQGVLPLVTFALKDDDWRIRAEATTALSKMHCTNPQLVLALLSEALKDEHWEVKKNAALGISHINPQLALTVIADGLQDGDEKVRSSAALALGMIGIPTNPQFVLPLLAEAFKDKYSWVRYCAIKPLGEAGPTNFDLVLPLLTEALKDNDALIRSDAARALGKIGHVDPQAVLLLLVKAFKCETSLFQNVAGRVSEVKKFFRIPFDLYYMVSGKSTFRSESTSSLYGKSMIRSGVVEAFGEIGHADSQVVIPLLAEALKERDEVYQGEVDAPRETQVSICCRSNAAKALGKIGHTNPQSVLPLLIEALKDNEESVRASAAEALKKYDLAFYLKSNPNLLCWTTLFTSTPLSSLITCAMENKAMSSLHLSAIALKCIVENQAIFQQDSSLCYYEQRKMCKIHFPKASEALLQIENLAQRYPKFIYEFSQSSTCLIQ
jgi:HEAT repeat protein/V8-like Glu-specific endopeptidase